MSKRYGVLTLIMAFFCIMAVGCGILLYQDNIHRNDRYVAYHNKTSSAISLDDYYRSKIDRSQASPLIKTYQTVNVGNKSYDFCIGYTDFSYGDIMNIDLMKGKWIEKEDLNLTNGSVVIGEQLAVDLWFTTDVVGRSIEIEGKAYEICGVYRERNTLLKSISSSNESLIYMSVSECADWDARVNSIFVFADSDSELIASSNSFSNIISSYNRIDGARVWTILLSVYFLSIVPSSAIALILSAILFSCLIVDVFSKRIAISFKTVTVLAILMIIIIIVVFGLSNYSFISPSVAPDNNIFDIPHYLNVMRETIYGNNQYIDLDGNLLLFNNSVILSCVLAVVLCFTSSFFVVCGILKLKSTVYMDQ